MRISVISIMHVLRIIPVMMMILPMAVLHLTISSADVERIFPSPQWSTYGGGPSRTGYSDFNIDDNLGEIEWSIQMELSPEMTPLVDHYGNIIVGSLNGELKCISPDGREVWTYRSGRESMIPGSIDERGMIYYPASSFLHCLDSNGKIIWVRSLNHDISCTPLTIPGGSLIIGNEEGELYSINCSDGSVEWILGIDGGLTNAASLMPDGSIVIPSREGILYKLANNGSLIWEVTLGSFIGSWAAVSENGTIYCGSYDGKLYCINPEGLIEWSFVTDSPIRSSPAVCSDGTICFANERGVVHFIGVDGSLLFRYDSRDRILAPPLYLSDGTVVLGTEDGILLRLDKEGNIIWNNRMNMEFSTGASPSMNGRIYQSSGGDSLVSIFRRHLAPPGSPMNLSGMGGEGWNWLEWNPPNMNGNLTLTGYSVYRTNLTTGKWEIIKTVPPDTLWFEDRDVQYGEDYSYRITAVNEMGESEPSNSVTCSPIYIPHVPSSPIGFKVESDEHGIVLSWMPPAHIGNGDLRYYSVYRMDPGGEWRLLDTTIENSYRDETAVPGEIYEYRITATNIDGEGSPTYLLIAGLTDLNDGPSDLEDETREKISVSDSLCLVFALILPLLIFVPIVMRAHKRGKISRSSGKPVAAKKVPVETDESKEHEDKPLSDTGPDTDRKTLEEGRKPHHGPELEAVHDEDSKGEDEPIVERILDLADKMARGEITKEEYRERRGELAIEMDRSRLID